jgi:hypothetical protein
LPKSQLLSAVFLLQIIIILQTEPSACMKLKGSRICAREKLNDCFASGYLNGVSAILLTA